MVLKSCVFIFILLSSTYGDDIDADYYFSSGLRRGTSSCKSPLSQFHCQIKCNMKPALCIEDNCYCVSVVPAKEINPDVRSRLVRRKSLKNKEIIDELVDFEDLKHPELPPPIESDSLYALRPTVRHQIAHFCPNLDVARACIRKCMARGKPAFCGKDHVCYCGHKYEHTSKDNGGNPKDIYSQYKDMYEKYFGPGFYGRSSELKGKKYKLRIRLIALKNLFTSRNLSNFQVADVRVRNDAGTKLIRCSLMSNSERSVHGSKLLGEK